MNVTQCRMARTALGWSGADLAKAAGVGTASVARFELGQTVQPETIAALKAAFVTAGVQFVDGGKLAGAVVPPR